MSREVANGYSASTLAGREAHGEKLDCVVRAFTVVSGKPYAVVRDTLARHGRKPGRRTSLRTEVLAARELGLELHDRCRHRITVATLCKSQVSHEAPIAAFVRGHAFAVIGGHIADFERVKPRCLVRRWWTRKPA